MADVTQEKILQALAFVKDGDGDIVSKKMVSGIQIKDGHVAFAIEVDPQRGPQLEPLRREAEKAVHALPGVISATVVLTAEKQAGGTPRDGRPGGPQAGQGHQHQHGHGHQHGHQHGAQQAQEPFLPNVRAIIAVASGKGGVGKSTTAVNLALAIAATGRKVGLLDADVYGPSIPRMLGISGKPTSSDGKTLDPKENFGIKAMSMGLLVEEESPVIWRGPMAQSALIQMIRDINWGTLDVLVVDMPPGTGDIHLSLAQQVPLAGAVIVTTPQDIALADARKGLNMFRKVEVPVFGIVENMSYFLCPHCGERTDIFSAGGGEREAGRMSTELLGQIPLDIVIRETSDGGTPIVASQPDSAHAKAYIAIAEKICAKIEETADSEATSAPTIIMQ
ncbi:MAG: iron-sulfur cluster carrier protein ApbC [Rhodospirillales bacterium]